MCIFGEFKNATMIESFKTIAAPAQGLYKEKGSKFLSFALPVKDTEEVKSIISSYRKEYYDARHVCYAYMLGAQKVDFRANDDGEPSGTAGRPIHGQIKSRELTNVLVIVVRYFGGVLLGTGGLITAYKEAAADALNQAQIVEKTVDCFFTILFDYPFMEQVMSAIKESDTQILQEEFAEKCTLNCSVSLHDKEQLIGKLAKVGEVKINS